MTGNRRERRRETPAGSRGRYGAGVLAIVFGGAMVVLALWMGQKDGRQGGAPSPGGPSEAAAAPVPLFTSATLTLASKFRCACGSCEEDELADCSCPEAVAAKQLIERELRAGSDEGVTVAAVQERYGGLKTDLTPRPPASPEQGSGGAGEREKGRTARGPAQEDDEKAITSRFICACGVCCTDDVLSDCDCDHPKGAKEMRAFIHYKVSQKKLSVEEVVKQVAYEYGHLRG